MSLDGVLVVHKPVGPTSHDVVATARRALRMRRVGHTGTLDPAASGVMVLVLGQATRLAQFLTATEKEYEAVIRFGVETDSYDMAGRIVRQSGEVPSREALVSAMQRFDGAIDQVPPAYSAKKVEGTRAYDLARRDRAVALAPVPVRVHTLELIEFVPPLARVRLVCSAGFYVRSLAHDLGQAVGTGAMLAALERRRSGEFTLAHSTPYEDLAGGRLEPLAGRVVPMERLLPDWPVVELLPSALRKIGHGQEVGAADALDGAPARDAPRVRLMSPHGRLVAIAKPAKTPGFLQPVVVFRYN